MAAQTDDKKLDGAGLSVLWGLIKNIIPTVPTNVSAFTNDASYVSLLDTHNKNLVLASPSGAAGLPSFRALVAADIPDLSGTYLTSHQSIKSLTLQGDGTTVSTFTANSAALTFNFKAGSNISLTRGTNEITIANTYSYSHPTGGANTTIAAANGKVLSAITVNNLGHVTSVSSKTLAAADIPDLSATYLTSHQTIYALKIQGDGTDVTTYTPNSATKTFNLKAGSNITLTRGTNEITIAGTANNYGVNIKDADDIVESHYYYPALAYDYPLTNVELYTGTISFYVGQKNTSSNTCCLGIGNSSYAGEIKLSNTTTAFAKITFKGSSGTYTSELPSANGTILNTGTTSFTQSLSSGTKIGTLKINGTSTDLYCQTNTNTTYTIATGDSNGQIKVTPSSGSAYNVSVKGLGLRAYDSTDYLPLTGGKISVSSKTFAYPLTIKNSYHSSDSQFVVGSGIKLELGSNSESTKYASILAESAGNWENLIDLNFYISNSGTEKEVMKLQSNGGVHFGGGVTLECEDPYNMLVLKRKKSGGCGMDFFPNNQSVKKFTIGCTSGETFKISEVNNSTETERISIGSSGNVGIGTTSPSYKLHVNGSAKVNTNLIVGTLDFSNSETITFDQFGNLKFKTNNSTSFWAIYNSSSASLVRFYTTGDVGIGMGATALSYKLQVNGAVGATAFTNTSDIRNKDFVSDLTMDIEQIANAPSFKFRWKTGDDKDIKAGSSAQYWNMVLPETVSAAKDEQRTLSMQYDVIALLSSIAIAKEVVNDKERIRQLEQRVSQLEAQLAN